MRIKNLLAIGFVLGLSVISILVTSSSALAQSVTISATSGPVDTLVSVTGSGFTANAAFQTYFAYGTTYQVTVDTGTVSSTGTLTTSFRIPSVPAGAYIVRVQTSSSYAVGSFVVTSAISLNVS